MRRDMESIDALDGPSISDNSRNEIYALAAKNPSIYAAIALYQQGHYSWEQTLMVLVIRLANILEAREEQLLHAIELQCPNPRRHE